MVRILHLLNDARGYVRRTRLECELIALGRSKLFPDMDHEGIVKIVHQQALIVDFEPKLAMYTLPVLLNTQTAQKSAEIGNGYCWATSYNASICIKDVRTN